MITKKQLAELVSHYNTQEAVFSPLLDANQIALMQSESSYTFTHLADFAKQLNEDSYSVKALNRKLRVFLLQRWNAFSKFSFLYPWHPFLPANQLCLKIAEAIADPEEAICQVLMPGIKDLNRDTYDLKTETEDNGHFAIENFIISQDHQWLIPVAEVMEMAAVDSNYVISDHQIESELRYKMGGRDLVHLTEVVGETSKVYMAAIKEHHTQRYDNGSIGFAIEKLAIALMKGSVEDAGSEYKADNKIISEAIKQFYDLWQSLSLEIKEEMETLRLQHYGNPTLSLKSYFLTLFVRHEDCPISEQERIQQQSEAIFPCAQQISNCLFEFLKQHKVLFSLSVHSQAERQELPDLKPQLDRVIDALKNRPQMIQDEDDSIQLLVTLARFMRKNHSSYKTIASALLPHLHSYTYLNALRTNEPLFKQITNQLDEKQLKKLFTNYENTLDILDFFDGGNQLKLIQAVSSQLKNWITPDNYDAFRKKLRLIVTLLFSKALADALTSQVNDFEKIIGILNTWKKTELSRYLLRNFNTLLKEHINNGNNLLLLLKSVPRTDRYELLQQFSFPINTTKLYLDCFALLPSSEKHRYLETVPLDFIHSLSELQEIMHLFDSPSARHIMYKRLNHNQLNCEQHVFMELFSQNKDKKALSPSKKEHILGELMEYTQLRSHSRSLAFFQSPDYEGHTRLIDTLTEQLHQPGITTEEAFGFIKQAHDNIATEKYYFYGQPQSLLYKYLDKLLQSHAPNEPNDFLDSPPSGFRLQIG